MYNRILTRKVHLLKVYTQSYLIAVVDYFDSYWFQALSPIWLDTPTRGAPLQSGRAQPHSNGFYQASWQSVQLQLPIPRLLSQPAWHYINKDWQQYFFDLTPHYYTHTSDLKFTWEVNGNGTALMSLMSHQASSRNSRISCHSGVGIIQMLVLSLSCTMGLKNDSHVQDS